MSADEWAEENANPMFGRMTAAPNRPAHGGQQMATGGDEQPGGQFKVIEVDTMTGWKQYLDNMTASPWTGTFTREEADACVQWREANITRRYAYKIVPVEPYMTDNTAARERHDARHGMHPMEDCSDIDCREAARRLFAEDYARRLAEAGEKGGGAQ